jgi:hypothetical protein
MNKFGLGLLLGLLLGLGIGWLAFSKKGQREVGKQVDAIERNVDQGLQEVDRTVNEVTK